MATTKPYTKYLFRWFYPKHNDPDSLEVPRGFVVGVASTSKYGSFPFQLVNLSLNIANMSFWPHDVGPSEHEDLMNAQYEPTQKEIDLLLKFLKVDDIAELKKKRLYKIFNAKDPSNPFLWF